ncbi:fumarylacetoacetate hydrolase family protein [Mesorhizobium sp. YR577]|uniref:fumarylacetoacetate hydrolase family protein n=1 Tax=Mesorhizobium sp. YR577 TaxID=1884373 RepID=UPI0008E291EF|nr:fumarylacetoacetate hydrolase family protein [Mesorhizobium sp. YR577]SFU18630.1 2-keto-4-pentenoate hydratase/2-oxohepta-3-ene-1,7-dioic acid hydratase (catechol pathway) [Mesorhizobium sp. YR577]
MKLATIQEGNWPVAAVMVGDELLVLSGDHGDPQLAGFPSTVIGLLHDGPETMRRLADVIARLGNDKARLATLRAAGALRPYDEDLLLAPIPIPGTMFAAGLNYLDHLEEMGSPIPKEAYVFHKSVASITGPRSAIARPVGHTGMVDWEAELAVAIGVECHRVSEADALSYVAGYMVANDVSARDWLDPVFQNPGIMEPIVNWDRNMMGKSFPTFCPLGPVLVTADEIPDPQVLPIRSRVNGSVMQESNTRLMIFSVAQIIAHLSRWYVLRPGDVILTGTPAGVGVGRTPRIFLQGGDVVEVEIQGLGRVVNSVQ